MPPSLKIGNRTVTEPDTGSTPAQFRVDLSKAALGTVTVDYQTADGTANAPGDYTTTTGTLTFTPGQVTKFIPVPVQGDTTDENNESYTITISSPTKANLADGRARQDHRQRPAAVDLDRRRVPSPRAAPRSSSR